MVPFLHFHSKFCIYYIETKHEQALEMISDTNSSRYWGWVLGAGCDLLLWIMMIMLWLRLWSLSSSLSSSSSPIQSLTSSPWLQSESSLVWLIGKGFASTSLTVHAVITPLVLSSVTGTRVPLYYWKQLITTLICQIHLAALYSIRYNIGR